MLLAMPFELRPLLKEDAYEAALLANAAYQTNAFRKILLPDEQRPGKGLFEKVIERIEKCVADPENNSAMQIYNTSAHKMAAYSLWNVTNPKTDEEWDREALERLNDYMPLPEANKDCVISFILAAPTNKKRIVGKDQQWWELDVLNTAPEYQRQGLGSMLMRAGIEEMEERGLPSVIISSEAGKPLYLRHGYQVVGTWSVDLREFGGPAKYGNTILVRYPITPEA